MYKNDQALQSTIKRNVGRSQFFVLSEIRGDSVLVARAISLAIFFQSFDDYREISSASYHTIMEPYYSPGGTAALQWQWSCNHLAQTSSPSFPSPEFLSTQRTVVRPKSPNPGVCDACKESMACCQVNTMAIRNERRERLCLFESCRRRILAAVYRTVREAGDVLLT